MSLKVEFSRDQRHGRGDPRWRSLSPFTTKPLSSGLGLPIVSQIISAHKGTIDYASEAGKGTTFKIALPAAGREGQMALKILWSDKPRLGQVAIVMRRC